MPALLWFRNRLTVSRRSARHAVRLFDKPRFVFAVTLSVLQLSAVGVRSEEPAQPADALLRQTVQPNQSVSVDSQSTHSRADEGHANAGDGGHAADSPPQPANPTLEPSPRSRPVRSEPRRFSVTESTPWFRTGLGALAIVLALILAGVWALRRWVPAARTSDHGALRVVARAGLSQKQSLALVQIARRFVLVAVSPDRVTVLSEIHDPDEVGELAIRCGKTPTVRNGFDQLLLRETAAYDAEAEADDENVRPTASAAGARRRRGALQDLLNRLRSLQSS